MKRARDDYEAILDGIRFENDQKENKIKESRMSNDGDFKSKLSKFKADDSISGTSNTAKVTEVKPQAVTSPFPAVKRKELPDWMKSAETKTEMTKKKKKTNTLFQNYSQVTEKLI